MMCDVLDGFETTFGAEALAHTLANAGRHSQELVPGLEGDKLLFALLEILDFECCKYGDAYPTLTEDAIRTFVLCHRQKVLALPSPPSYLGVLTGSFSFLCEDESEAQNAGAERSDNDDAS